MNDFPYVITQPPVELPITLANLKAWLKLDIAIPANDALLEELIKAAAIYAQEYMGGIILINTTFLTFRNCFYKKFLLKRAPLQTVNFLKYYLDGTLETLDAADYYTTVDTGYSDLVFNDYPSTIDLRLQAIQIEFVAGFGATADDIPADLQIALKMHVAAMYENRGDCDNPSTTTALIVNSLPVASRNIYSQRQILSVNPYNEL